MVCTGRYYVFDNDCNLFRVGTVLIKRCGLTNLITNWIFTG